MKVIAFTIPVRQDRTVILQREEAKQFYPHLHRHEEVQLTWVQRGRGTLLVGEELYDFAAGDVFLFSANLPHLFKSEATDGPGITALSLFFKKDNTLWELPELKEVRQFLIGKPGAFRVKDLAKIEIYRVLQEIEEHPPESRLPHFIGLMQRLVRRSELELIGRSTVPLVSDKDGLRVNTIMQFTMSHFDRNISLREVAAQVHMAPGSFCRFFKKRTGKTFVRFLNEIRIREACRQLLQYPDRQIAEIAFGCGFKNISSFNRVFRQVRAQSPTEYLLSLKQLI